MGGDRPLWCPVLVGRDDVLELAERRVQTLLQGRGHVMLLAGEAGIGKTRLLEAVLRRVRRAGLPVASGAAFPRDLEVTAAALVDLAHGLAHGEEPWWHVGAAVLQRLEAVDQTLDGETHRRRRLLVLDVVEQLAGLAAHGPVVLAMEDLHWSDDLTLEVLSQLSRRTPDLPMLVVGTYRSDELYPRIPMRRWRSRLISQRLAEEVRLARLTAAQTLTMVASLRGGDLPPSTDLVERIHQRTDGVPLYVEEVVGASGTHGVPESLADAVLERCSVLDASTRAVADAAAVIGRRFDAELLTAVLGEPERDLDEALRQLQDHFVVIPADRRTAAFDFHHALVRDVLYDRVPPVTRRRLHGRIAEVARRRGAPAAFLSVHYEEAGASADAHEHALTAARRAAGLGAHREALDLYRRAERTAPEQSPANLARMLAELAAEAAATDHNELAAESYARARDLLLGCGAVLDAAALSPPLVAARHLLGDDLAARLAPLHAALESVGGAPGGERVEARVLAGISAAYMLDRHLDDSIEHGQRARTLARKVGDEATEIDAAVTVGSCMVFAGRMTEGWDLLEQGVARAVARQREAQAARAYRMIGSSASVLVEYDRAEAVLREGGAYAERVELWNDHHYMAAHLAHVLWATGDWAGADRLTQAALVDGQGGITTRITALHVRGYLALGRGAWGRAEQHLSSARALGEAMGELQRVSPALWGLAECAQLQGRADEAVALCEAGRAASAAVADAAYLFPFLVTGTRAHLALGDLTGAGRWVDDVSERLRRRAIPGTLPSLDHAAGLLALAGGSPRRAQAALRAARSGWRAGRRAWDACAAAADLARCALRAGSDDEAARLATAAAAEAAALGAAPLQHLAQEVLARAEARGAVAEAWAPLTAREYAVARLVATGLTNKQIAAELRIAPKTVAAHVSHILTRLDAGRRAEIARWVGEVEQVRTASSSP